MRTSGPEPINKRPDSCEPDRGVTRSTLVASLCAVDRNGQARAVTGSGVTVQNTLGNSLADRREGEGKVMNCGLDIFAGECIADAFDMRAHAAEVDEVTCAPFDALTIAFCCLFVIRHGAPTFGSRVWRASICFDHVVLSSGRRPLCVVDAVCDREISALRAVGRTNAHTVPSRE